MVVKKPKGKQHETETQSSDGVSLRMLKREKNPTYYPSKGMKRKSDAMEVKKKRMKVSGKLKRPNSKVHKNSKAVSRRGHKRRTRICDLYDDIETQRLLNECATRIVSRLGDDALCFRKFMLPSNVKHGFWMHLPTHFCDKHLPARDATITLVDEEENTYQTNYILERHGLSGGWRSFSLSHYLLKGDVLVFHLIDRCKFKVYIVRVHSLEEIKGALCLVNLSASNVLRANLGREAFGQPIYFPEKPFLCGSSSYMMA